MPPRGILVQRLEEDFHGVKEFILLFSIQSSFSLPVRSLPRVLKQQDVLLPMIFGAVLRFCCSPLHFGATNCSGKNKRFRGAGGESDNSPA
jgi:hypothetical protein